MLLQAASGGAEELPDGRDCALLVHRGVGGVVDVQLLVDVREVLQNVAGAQMFVLFVTRWSSGSMCEVTGVGCDDALSRI